MPAFRQNIDNLRGVSPDVQLASEPWGHVNHSDGNCESLSSDRTGAYIHDLALMPRECLAVPELEDASVHKGGSCARMSHASGMGAGGRDQCHLCLIGQARMATYSWLFMCGGRRACWCHLIGSGL